MKQIFIGKYGQTNIFVHVSYPIAALLMWFVVATMMIPAIGLGYSAVVNGLIATLILTTWISITLGYDFGRLAYADAHGRDIKKLVLLPISSLLISSKPLDDPKEGQRNSFLPSLPLIFLTLIFSLLSLSPTAEPMQVIILQQLSAFTTLFIFARLMGFLALDRTSLLHSTLWLMTKNIKVADFAFQAVRNFSIAALPIASIAMFSTYQWVGVALATVIALGLQDAIFYRRLHKRRFQFMQKKAEGQRRLGAI